MRIGVVLILSIFLIISITSDSFGEISKPSITFENKLYTIDDRLVINFENYEFRDTYNIINPDGIQVKSLSYETQSKSFQKRVNINELGITESNPYPKNIISGIYTIETSEDIVGEFELFIDESFKKNHSEIILDSVKSFYNKNDVCSN